MKTWTIGRAADCDLIVDGDDVSMRHCELMLTVGGFLLRDLDSQQGTFVDGKRITRLVFVSQQNAITLGRATAMPWPAKIDSDVTAGIAFSAEAKAFRIGRYKNNDIVLDRETVSGNHALLIVDGDRMLIEDLGSQAGTAIGSPSNTVQNAEVKENDRLFFGSFSIMATHLVAMTKKRSVAEDAKAPAKPTAPIPAARKSATPWAAIIAAVAATLAIVGVICLLMLRGGNERLADRAATQLGSSNPSNSRKADSKVNATDAKLLATVGDTELSEPFLITKAADSLFLVLATDDSSDAMIPVSTAWLAEPDRLVTTATIASGLANEPAPTDDQAAQSQRLRVVQVTSGKRLDVAEVSTAPRFTDTQQQYDTGRQQFEALQTQIDSLTSGGNSDDQGDPSGGNANSTADGREERLAAIRKEQQAIVAAGLQMKAQRARLNVAVLGLSQPVIGVEPTAIEPAARLSRGQLFHMHCTRCPPANVPFEDAILPEPFGIAVIVEQRLASPEPDLPDRWVMKMKAQQTPMNMLGSPILNGQGIAVAMFSDFLAERISTTDPNQREWIFEAISLLDGTFFVDK